VKSAHTGTWFIKWLTTDSTHDLRSRPTTHPFSRTLRTGYLHRDLWILSLNSYQASTIAASVAESRLLQFIIWRSSITTVSTTTRTAEDTIFAPITPALQRKWV
ncbi:hypothetical protein HAX54_048773, partial [Datura stramonium]|nr:hypothetical protein [Datura stramonium]